MSALFGVLGFLGFIVGMVLILVGFIKKKKYKGGIVTLVAIIFIIIGVALPSEDTETSGKKESGDSQEVAASTSTSENDGSSKEDATEVEEEPVELTPQQKMTQSIVDLMASKQTFDTGSYTKGDIPEGEYAFIPFTGSGKYYAEKDLTGNIIDNENFESFGYVYVHGKGNIETKGVLISIKAFEKLGVHSAKDIFEKVNNVENYQDSGWYKVGVDIPAGEYIIESYGEGYVAIMSGPVGKNEIVDNEIFNGRYTVNVTDGQYLVIKNGTITK